MIKNGDTVEAHQVSLHIFDIITQLLPSLVGQR